MYRILACLMLALCTASADAQPAPGPAATEILDVASCWRYHLMLRPPVVTAESFKAAGRPQTADTRCPQLAMNRSSAPPPGGWAGPDFDDITWPRGLASEINTALTGKAHSFRASLRGKFNVTDPSSVGEVTLTVNYRGGLRVLLNGVEVARRNLPAGELGETTPGNLYPNSAWVDAAGKALSSQGKWPADRDHLLGPLKLPASAFRKGVNVLAIELRRSPFHPVALGWNDSGHPPTLDRWVPIGLLEAKLTATGKGIEPNVSRPKGLQVWTQDRNDRVTIHDRGDPTESLYPVKIVAARNGSWCSQLGVGSDGPIKGLSVKVSDLVQADGRATIAASQVTLLYGVGVPAKQLYDDRLAETPPAEVAVNAAAGAAVMPVVVRVHVPAGAAPGDYRGRITVSADGAAAATVPLDLHVSAWTLPDPKDYRTFASIYQSPDTVAMQYKVEMWSEQHWKLLERSWELLGRAGNNVAVVHAVEETQFGNPQSTIFWVKKPDGSYDWDFTAFDRYLKMAIKHCGRIDHVALQMVHVGNIFNSHN